MSFSTKQRMYLVRFISVRRQWRKQHGVEHLGDQEEERRSNFVYPESFFRSVFNEIRECGIAGRVRLIFDAPCKKNSS